MRVSSASASESPTKRSVALSNFTDPYGISNEATCWAVDATGRPADYADPHLFGDPDPVPAVRELAERGELTWMPATHLVGDEVVDPV